MVTPLLSDQVLQIEDINRIVASKYIDIKQAFSTVNTRIFCNYVSRLHRLAILSAVFLLAFFHLVLLSLTPPMYNVKSLYRLILIDL